MSSLLDNLDSNQSENDDIHLLFPKCKPRASSVGTESQSSESQSNSQQYLADNFRDQNLNHHHHHHHPSSVSGSGGGGHISSSSSTRQSSRRHSSSGYTQQQQYHHLPQTQHHHLQNLPDNLKHSKHSSYPPLIQTTSTLVSTSQAQNNTSFISHGSLSPYDNNNVSSTQQEIVTGKQDSTRRSSSHHISHHHHSSSRHHHNNHLQQQQQQQQEQQASDSSDNFPLTSSFCGKSAVNFSNQATSSGGNSSVGSTKKIEGHPSNHYSATSGHTTHHNSGGGGSTQKSHHHHHSRSKNSISSRNSRHEAAVALAAQGSGSQASQTQSGGGRHRTSHHHHNSNNSTSERPHHHHRSKKLTQMTESSSCEPISPATISKTTRHNSNNSSNNSKSQKCGAGSGAVSGGPSKSYSTLSLGSGMELDDHHHHHYDDTFCSTRSSRTLPTSNGASSYNNSERTTSTNLPGNGSCLRDSRIEIAGGREIYSQNRIRAGRRLRGSSSTSSSTEMMADSSISMTASSSSSAGNKQRRKSPNVQQQQQQQLVCTNGDDMMDEGGGSPGEISVWEPKHSKGYPDNGLVPRPHHHSSSTHRHHGSQHHHHSRHHHSQHHHHQRSRHVCGFPHCDHKLISPTDLSPACGGGAGNGSSYIGKNPGGPNIHNNTSATSTPMTVKETVFSTEITSIEKPIDPEQTSAASKRSTSSGTTQSGGMPSPYVYETQVTDSTGEIIFDDIGNSWERKRAGGATDSSGRTRKENLKRSPSSGSTSTGSTAPPGSQPTQQQLNFFHSALMGCENDGGGVGGGGIHCCSSVEHMNRSGSSINASSAPTVLLQGSPSPSTRGGNTTPSGYESDEYSGVTPVSLMGCGSSNNNTNSSSTSNDSSGDKGCLPNNRLIGAVPIAEYEGSPKRYGLRQPTHPMPTHLDLVDVDIPMDSANGGCVRSPSDNTSVNSTGVVTSHHNHHVVSLISPGQGKPATGVIPTTASSSSSSSLDNTNSAASSTSSSTHHHSSHSHHHGSSHHHHHHHHNHSSHHRSTNLYNTSRTSPSVISPSKSVSSFPSRVPGFPQRITPVTSSLDSSSLVDSGLDKSEGTDVLTKSDNGLELAEEGDGLVCHQSSINNDECPPQQDQMKIQYQTQQQQPQHQITHHLGGLTRQESSSHGSHHQSLRSSDIIDEPPCSTSSCQGQLVSSDHSSDLLLTDQLNIKAEKSTPSNTPNLCGNPLDDNQQMRQLHQPQQQQHQLVLELVDSAVTSLETHNQSLQLRHHTSFLQSVGGQTGEEQQHSNNSAAIHDDSLVGVGEEQCLISVPSSTEPQRMGGTGDTVLPQTSPAGGADGHGNNLIGISPSSASQQDYLYEFSETRKVLEEFFGNTHGGGGASAQGGVPSNNNGGSAGVPSYVTLAGLDGTSMMSQGPLFDDLDYTLKRQAGNSYVGQRLAGESSCSGAVEESPKKPARRGVLLLGSAEGQGADGCEAASPRLISFQEITLPQLQQQQQKGTQNPPRDLNDNDIDGDSSSSNTETDNLGDTEVGLQVKKTIIML